MMGNTIVKLMGDTEAFGFDGMLGSLLAQLQQFCVALLQLGPTNIKSLGSRRAPTVGIAPRHIGNRCISSEGAISLPLSQRNVHRDRHPRIVAGTQHAHGDRVLVHVQPKKMQSCCATLLIPAGLPSDVAPPTIMGDSHDQVRSRPAVPS